MSSRKQLYHNIMRVMFSRGATLLSNVAVGFLLPRILGVTGYGYMRAFTLYFTYTSLLHFGFADGVLLRFAGKDYQQLDKKDFRTYTVFFALFQLIVAVVLCVSSLFIKDKEYSYIVLMIGADTFFNNMMTYYMFISQATQRFKEFSARSFILAVVKLLLVAALYIADTWGVAVSYRVYLLALVIVDFLMLVWYVWTYRDITFGEKTPFRQLQKSVADLFKTGVILTIAYQVAHFVFVLDNQFVNVFYDTDTFGIYAFAYSIVTMISTLISSTAAVLLPMLKSIKGDSAMRYYDSALIGVTCVAGLSMLLIYPLDWFIKWFLPQYTESLAFLKIVMPSLMLSACISVVMFTFYKVLDKQKIYLYVGLGALAVGFVSNALAQWIWASPYTISWASVITVMVWYCLSSVLFVKEYHHRPLKNILYILLISAVFYAVSFANLFWWLSAVICLMAFMAITIVFYRKEVKMLLRISG